MNTAEQPTPSTLRTPRHELFKGIHKSLRFAMGAALARMGSTDFSDEGAAARAVEELTEVVSMCEDHLAHEEQFVLPALAARSQGAPTIRAAHEQHVRTFAELRALGESVLCAQEALRPRVAHSLYLHFSVFVGDNLTHMAEEEQVIQPLMERLFTDDELRSIQERIMAALSPAQRVRAARTMLPAMSRPERVALVTGMAATAPREAMLALMDVVRPVLSAEDFADLVARTRASEAS